MSGGARRKLSDTEGTVDLLGVVGLLLLEELGRIIWLNLVHDGMAVRTEQNQVVKSSSLFDRHCLISSRAAVARGNDMSGLRKVNGRRG